MKNAFKVIVLLFIALSTNAQFDHVDVLKGLSDNDLFLKLKQDYKPTTNLPYSSARDTLYKLIDILPGNKLECVYTGYQITLDLNADPTTDAFAKGINAEHSYPQSKGADSGLGNSDMNHIYPSRENVNNDRSSHPYGESPDNNTMFWYFNDLKSSNIPSSNIDNYSEFGVNNSQTVFEPRESMKGNIARGMFYFYTMYRDEALAAEPSFFESQKKDLCDWHFNDPVDEREWNRTHKIAPYQDQKVNPFILDCSLASRLYCDQISDACELLTSTLDLGYNEQLVISEPYPMPAFEKVKIGVTSSKDSKLFIRLLDTQGILKYASTRQVYEKQNTSIEVPLPDAKGVYFLMISSSNNQFVTKKIVKI